MKVIEHILNAKNPRFSFEIVPPPRGRSVQDIVDIVEALKPINPAWIDVTSHSAGAVYNETATGSVERRVYKKRPGTLGICGIIQNRFKIDTVAHLLCDGFTQEETEDALIEMNYLGIHNILALKGDTLNYKKEYAKNRKVNHYASDLVAQINQMRKGHFLDSITESAPLDFCIGVAAYPEKHFEAPNLKTDIKNFKNKIDQGADYAVSQMFFENKYYHDFLKATKEEGITTPIIPGIKILKSKGQLTNLPKNFYINMPDELVEEIMKKPEHASEIGQNWAYKQALDLLENNAPVVHFYIMNDATQVVDVVKKLQKI